MTDFAGVATGRATIRNACALVADTRRVRARVGRTAVFEAVTLEADLSYLAELPVALGIVLVDAAIVVTDTVRVTIWITHAGIEAISSHTHLLGSTLVAITGVGCAIISVDLVFPARVARTIRGAQALVVTVSVMTDLTERTVSVEARVGGAALLTRVLSASANRRVTLGVHSTDVEASSADTILAHRAIDTVAGVGRAPAIKADERGRAWLRFTAGVKAASAVAELIDRTLNVEARVVVGHAPARLIARLVERVADV